MPFGLQFGKKRCLWWHPIRSSILGPLPRTGDLSKLPNISGRERMPEREKSTRFVHCGEIGSARRGANAIKFLIWVFNWMCERGRRSTIMMTCWEDSLWSSTALLPFFEFPLYMITIWLTRVRCSLFFRLIFVFVFPILPKWFESPEKTFFNS